MKVFATIFVAVIFVASSLAAPQQENEANANEQPQGLYHPGQELHADLNRFRKATDEQQQAPAMRSAYGGSAPGQSYSAQSYSSVPAAGPAISYSYQAPAPMMPCAKNLLLSCAPSVAPVPCAAPLYSSSYSSPSSYSSSSSYGSAGAYSEYAPQWAVAPPQMGHYQNFYGY